MSKVISWAFAMCERGPDLGFWIIIGSATWISGVDLLLIGQTAPAGSQAVAGFGAVYILVWVVAHILIRFLPPPGGGGGGDDPDLPPLPSPPRLGAQRTSRSRPASCGYRRMHPGARERVRSPVRLRSPGGFLYIF